MKEKKINEKKKYKKPKNLKIPQMFLTRSKFRLPLKEEINNHRKKFRFLILNISKRDKFIKKRSILKSK